MKQPKGSFLGIQGDADSKVGQNRGRPNCHFEDFWWYVDPRAFPGCRVTRRRGLRIAIFLAIGCVLFISFLIVVSFLIDISVLFVVFFVGVRGLILGRSLLIENFRIEGSVECNIQESQRMYAEAGNFATVFR